MATVRGLRDAEPIGSFYVLRNFRSSFGVVGYVSRNPDGWRYLPQVAGRNGSRKPYPTAYEACRRHVHENDVVMTHAEAVDAGILKARAG